MFSSEVDTDLSFSSCYINNNPATQCHWSMGNNRVDQWLRKLDRGDSCELCSICVMSMGGNGAAAMAEQSSTLHTYFHCIVCFLQ